MRTVVAIPKDGRFHSEALSDASLSEKHLVIQEEKEHPAHGPVLGKIGIEPAPRPGGGNGNPALVKSAVAPSFVRLPYLGAYIIRAKTNQQVREVEEAFGEEYAFAEDVDVPLIHASGGGPRGPRSHPDRAWPDDSGVHLAHQQGIRGNGVKVAVLDTGCDNDHVQFDHQDVAFRYVSPASPVSLRAVRGFDPGGHGTHVCGIVAGKNTGVAPDASLLVASVIESERNETSIRRILTALDWVLSSVFADDHNGTASEPVILNFSFGFSANSLSNASVAALLDTLRASMRILLHDFDVLPIVAVGNEGQGIARYPAIYPECLSVGAVNFQNEVADFSGSGNFQVDGQTRMVPEVSGYGHEVYSALERNQQNRSVYAKKSGTSMATPYVSGIAALYASQEDGSLRGLALRDRLLKTALPLPTQPTGRVGKGLARFVP